MTFFIEFFRIFFPSVNTSKPLFGMEFAIVGRLQKSYKQNKDIIENMGGRVVTLFLGKKTAAVISKEEEVNKIDRDMMPMMVRARELELQVVPESFLDAVKTADPFDLIKYMNISSWRTADVSQSKLF